MTVVASKRNPGLNIETCPFRFTTVDGAEKRQDTYVEASPLKFEQSTAAGKITVIEL